MVSGKDLKLTLGETERQIVELLESKAKSAPESEWLTSSPYSSAKEIATVLGKSTRTTNNSLRRLVSKKQIKVYANKRKYKLLYGPSWLPNITWEELLQKSC